MNTNEFKELQLNFINYKNIIRKMDQNIVYKEFADWINMLMARNNYSVEQLANNAGEHIDIIKSCIAGERLPSLKLMLRMIYLLSPTIKEVDLLNDVIHNSLIKSNTYFKMELPYAINSTTIRMIHRYEVDIDCYLAGSIEHKFISVIDRLNEKDLDRITSILNKYLVDDEIIRAKNEEILKAGDDLFMSNELAEI